MKIAEVVQYYYPGIGGAVRYIKETGKRLSERGHEITVLTTNAINNNGFMSVRNGKRIKAGEYMDGRVKVIRFQPLIIPFLQSRLPILRFGPMTPQVAKACLNEKYDLIHVHCLPYSHLAWAWLARRLGSIPLILTPDIKQGMRLTKDMLRYIRGASALAVRTVWEAKYLHDEYGIRNRIIYRIGMGVDVNLFSSASDYSHLHEMEDIGSDRIVLYIGRLSPPKGIQTLIEAFHQILNATLVVVGPKNRYWEICIRSADEKTRQRIVMVGAVRNDSLLISLYNMADVIAYPSRDDSFGAVILESWASGKPVVTCPIGGPGELVDPPKNGLFSQFGDPDDLAQKISYLLENPGDAAKMGFRGRKKAQQYDWSSVTDRLEDLYNSFSSLSTA